MPPARPTAPAAPSSTYRLQLTPAFPFRAAEAAVPYLASLGVSHLHLSPLLEAVPGSSHGYDVTDHSRVREELGGEQELRRLARTARTHGMGLVADIVPNHMAARPRHNRALWQVLRDGPGSPYARWFDVDWEAGGGRVVLPVLTRPLAEELPVLHVDDFDGEKALYHGAEPYPLREGTAHLPLPRLLDAQHYRLCGWRVARTELNYRRFFTVCDLIALRVEDPEVFRATHAALTALLDEGVLDGLRVDHPDGLADPGRYLARLRAASGGRWTVVEKILADGERLPAAWPVAGTTGYDALRHVDGVLTDPAGAAVLRARYRRFAAPPADRGGDWAATVRRAAYEVTGALAAELDRLTRECARLCAAEPALRDHAPGALRTALTQLLVGLPVYRPYPDADRPVPDASALLTDDAAREARRAFAGDSAGHSAAGYAEDSPGAGEAAVDAVRGLVLGRYAAGSRGDGFRARFAQTASALRAKSVEDAAFYRYAPLLSACEVGADPGAPTVPPAAFHAFCVRMQRDWPLTGTVLATHDTKRSDGVRARIALLAECPDRWAELVAEAASRTAARAGAHAPDPVLAWQAWQTALAFADPWPPSAGDRIRRALRKHAREAGVRTSWTEPDEAYEAALSAFVTAGPCGAARPLLTRFAVSLRPYVRARVLAAALVHLTMPGVPELYQGTESDRRTLVDPDNRAPVPFPPSAPDAPDAQYAPEVVTPLSAEKTALTGTVLRLRARRPEVFGAAATYRPVAATGPAAAHCLAFIRSETVLTAVTRLPLRLADSGGWRDTVLALPPGRWCARLTPAPGPVHEGRVRVAELFASAPVTLLERADGT